jgi:PadR family transcriptional regulator PadR
MGSEYLGEFEQLVLLAIVRLGTDAYGVTIRRTIEDRAERSVSFGAVYSTLRRLETKGYVGSCVPIEESDHKAAGRPKRTFEITDRGLDVLHSAQRRIQRMAEGVSALKTSA